MVIGGSYFFRLQPCYLFTWNQHNFEILWYDSQRMTKETTLVSKIFNFLIIRHTTYFITIGIARDSTSHWTSRSTQRSTGLVVDQAGVSSLSTSNSSQKLVVSSFCFCEVTTDSPLGLILIYMYLHLFHVSTQIV